MANPIQNCIIPNHYFFEFRDERQYNHAPNANCCQKWLMPAKPKNWNGSIVHTPSGDIYGYGHAKDDCTLRTLFF